MKKNIVLLSFLERRAMIMSMLQVEDVHCMNDEMKKLEEMIHSASTTDELYSFIRFRFPEFVADFSRAYKFSLFRYSGYRKS